MGQDFKNYVLCEKRFNSNDNLPYYVEAKGSFNSYGKLDRIKFGKIIFTLVYVDNYQGYTFKNGKSSLYVYHIDSNSSSLKMNVTVVGKIQVYVCSSQKMKQDNG